MKPRPTILTIMAAGALLPGLAMAQSPAPTHKDESPVQVTVKGLQRTRPVDAPPPLDFYARTPLIEQATLSPDGSQVAFVSRVGDQRFLATYRFADKTHHFVKIRGGNVSTISWADADHVLVSDSRMALRGTCDAGTGGSGNQTNPRSVVPDAKPGDAASQIDHDIALSLVDSMTPPRCAYFGVRGENAVTSVDINAGTSVAVGMHMGDAANMPLGVPETVSVDGRPILMGPFMEMRASSVGNQPAQRVYLWQLDPASAKGKLIDDGGGDLDRENHYVDDWIFDRNGGLLARTVYDFTSRRYSIQMKAAGQWKPVLTRTIVPKDHTFAPFLIGAAHDGQSVVILDTETHGQDAEGTDRRFHYYELSPQGTLSAPLETGEAGQNRPIFHPVTGRLAGFAHAGEETEYNISDPGLAALYTRVKDAAPGETVRVISVSDDLAHVLIYAQGGEDTGSYYMIDFANGRSAIIGEDFPQVPTNWIALQRAVSYPAADGTEIHAMLTLPPKPAGRNLPLVVLPHDGPQAHDALGFDWLAQALASRGYLVLQPNYRGSNGYGEDFIKAGYGGWGGKMLSDINDGVADLIKQGLADPGRVCMAGIGYGGYAALAAASAPGVRCAISIDGISDVADYLEWKKNNVAQPDPDDYASLAPDPVWPRAFSTNPDALRTLQSYVVTGTPAISARAIRAPVLLIHQNYDPLVPVRQSRSLRDALQAAGKSVTYVEIDGGTHAPATEATRKATLEAVTAFLAVQNPAQ